MSIYFCNYAKSGVLFMSAQYYVIPITFYCLLGFYKNVDRYGVPGLGLVVRLFSETDFMVTAE